MNPEVYSLNDFLPALNQAGEATLTAFRAVGSAEDPPEYTRPAIVIFPGGGYQVLTGSAEAAARYFQEKGFHAFSVKYSIAPARYPTQLLQAAAAIAYVRRNAADFGVDPHRVAVMGFSAGGHLAATIGTLYGEPVIQSVLNVSPAECRPDTMVLCYPVITSGEHQHPVTFNCLVGENADPALLRKVSLENAVTPDTPPAFLWHTFEDAVVPVESSMLFAAALRKNGVPFDLHIFRRGPHGLGLCTSSVTGESGKPAPSGLPAAHWKTLAIEWLEDIFGISKKSV